MTGPAVVRYGADFNALDQVVLAKLDNTHFPNAMEWVAEINGLRPNSKYLYSIEADQVTLAGADPHCCFRTAPPIGSSEKLRFLFLGDSGANRPREPTVSFSIR